MITFSFSKQSCNIYYHQRLNCNASKYQKLFSNFRKQRKKQTLDKQILSTQDTLSFMRTNLIRTLRVNLPPKLEQNKNKLRLRKKYIPTVWCNNLKVLPLNLTKLNPTWRHLDHRKISDSYSTHHLNPWKECPAWSEQAKNILSLKSAKTTEPVLIKKECTSC